MNKVIYTCECSGRFHDAYSNEESEKLMYFRQKNNLDAYLMNKDCPNEDINRYKIVKETEHMVLVEK